MAQFVDKDSKPLAKSTSNLFIMASETSIARKAEICRGIMTLHQTEQWSFVTKDAMKALRKPLVNFKNCTTASQCIGPIDLPDSKDVWQLTVGVKKQIYGDAIQRPGGPDPMVPRSAADPAAEGEEQQQKARRNNDTVEPITFHGTPEATWEEILNIAGANNPVPRMVCELVCCDATFAFLCLKKGVPYQGVCYNMFHKDLLQKHLAQLVFNSMLKPHSPFGTAESCLELQKLWNGKNQAKSDDDEDNGGEDDSDDAGVVKKTGKGRGRGRGRPKASGRGGVSHKRKKRQAARASGHWQKQVKKNG